MNTLCQVWRTPLGATLAAVVLGACGAAENHSGGSPAPVSTAAYVTSVAEAQGIPTRTLFAVAYSQSQFGLQSQTSGASQNLLLSPNRNDYFGFLPPQKSADFRESTQIFAKNLGIAAQQNHPQKPFEWLLLSAKIIAGDEPDVNLRDTTTRLVLQDLVHTSNNGFTVLLPKDEIISLPPVPTNETISEAQMNLDQRRYFTDFRLGPEPIARVYAEGSKNAVSRTRLNHDQVNVEIRWCPGNLISCFEHLRQTSESPSHFLYYKNHRNIGDLIQFHTIKKDLNWYGQALENTVSITVIGFAGLNSKAYTADWIDWEDHVALARFSDEILAELGVSTNDLATKVREKWRDDAPPGKPNFVLSKLWDSLLFHDILTNHDNLRDVSPVKVEFPLSGQILNSREVMFRIYPGTDGGGGTLTLYQDSEHGAPGENWDLILKTDLAPLQRMAQVSQRFEKPGVSANSARAVKCEVRDNSGKLIGTRIVRFLLPGLYSEKKEQPQTH